MILKSIITNPLDGKPKPWRPWYGYLFLAVGVVGLGLYLYQRANGGPVVPTMTIPSQVYANAKAALQHQQRAVVRDVTDQDEALQELARTAASAINTSTEEGTPLPATTDLAVPFTTQSPSGAWTESDRDLSEEAVFLMAFGHFVPGMTIDEAQLEKIRTAMVSSRLSMAAFASFVETYDPGFRATVIEDPTIGEIKTYIAKGIPVIVPTDGSLLQNPFYISGGLPHHCILLRGYEGESFFANDPGTRRGEKYVYAQSTVMTAMSDWDDDELSRGKKRVLIIQPR